MRCFTKKTALFFKSRFEKTRQCPIRKIKTITKNKNKKSLCLKFERVFVLINFFFSEKMFEGCHLQRAQIYKILFIKNNCCHEENYLLHIIKNIYLYIQYVYKE